MFPTINKKETGVNLRRIMDMRGVKPKDIQEYLGFGCVQSVYRWLDGVSMPTVDNLYAISKMLQVPMDSIVCGNAGRTKSQMDVWEMFSFLQTLIPDMLQTLKDTRTGSPGYLGENYTNENGILVNDTCHEEWNCILDKMIFLWREAEKDTCSQKNPFDEAHSKAMDEFKERFGLFGNKLQTEKELEENRKRGGGGTIHFMDELPEYKEISDKYREEEKRLEEYRRKCKDEAIDMLKQYFYDLWD